MTDIDQLIRLNVELEGALRVLQARPSDHAVAVAQEKFAALSEAFTGLGYTPEETPAEVKEDEAVAAEEAPAEEPSEADVPPTQVVESDTQAETVAQTEADTSQAIGDIRRNITINDRFLFRRELFGGSDEEFNDTLDLIATMHSPEEAAEYLFDDLAWDRENPTVKEFWSLVKGYFAK